VDVVDVASFVVVVVVVAASVVADDDADEAVVFSYVFLYISHCYSC